MMTEFNFGDDVANEEDEEQKESENEDQTNPSDVNKENKGEKIFKMN